MIAMLLCLLFGHPAPAPDVGMLALTLPSRKTTCRRCFRVVEVERRARDGRVVVKKPTRTRR